MSITETPVEAPKPKRKYVRRKKAVAAKPQPPAGLAGLTMADCPKACTAEQCVISGAMICAHPYKGGLQIRCTNTESLARFNAAKLMLGKKKLKVKVE